MNKSLQKKVNSKLKDNFKDQVKFLQKLVRIDSSNPYTPEESPPNEPIEKEVAELIVEKLESFGLKPETFGSKNRPNVICKTSTGGSKELVFNGHMDTVPASDDYSFDPWAGKIEKGRLWGLGAADMKASLSAFVYLAKIAKELNLSFNGDLTLTFVVDEEPGGCSDYGTKLLLEEEKINPDGAIVAEPGTDQISIGHKGGYRFKLTTFGESVHTGLPKWEKKKKGKNAILEMQKAIQVLNSIEIPYEESTGFPNSKPVFTFPTKLKGGSAINSVPGRCAAYGDIRLLPPVKEKEVEDLLRKKLDQLDIEYELEKLLFVPPVIVSKEERLVKDLKQAADRELETSPDLKGAGPWNDGWMFIERNIPAICGFGPQGGGVHGDDEWVDLNSLETVTKIYLQMAIKYLGLK